MQLVDAHCHFDFPRFDDDRDGVLARASAGGVKRLVIPGVRQSDWSRGRELAAQVEGIDYCLGIHPWFIAEHGPEALAELELALRTWSPAPVALGECGLDRLKGELAEQQPWFERQVDLARKLALPLVVHSVRCHDEVAAVLARKRVDVPVLVHGFAGSYQQASRLVALGCYLGVGGVITYDRARKTRDALARVPVESLVLETDAPDMPPAGVRPGNNSPEQLPSILSALAALRPESEAELAGQIWTNTAKLYGW